LVLGKYSRIAFFATHQTGEVPMSILTVFYLSTMDTEKYNRAIAGLEAAGQGMPKGRLYHIAARQEDGSIVVTDIWESAALLEEFGKTLIPTLNRAGVTPVEPKVYTVVNVIEGKEVAAVAERAS
jgi:hypothetical protein